MSISKIKSLSSDSLDAFCSDGSHTHQSCWCPSLLSIPKCLHRHNVSLAVWCNFYVAPLFLAHSLYSVSVGIHGSFQVARLNPGIIFTHQILIFPHIQAVNMSQPSSFRLVLITAFSFLFLCNCPCPNPLCLIIIVFIDYYNRIITVCSLSQPYIIWNFDGD